MVVFFLHGPPEKKIGAKKIKRHVGGYMVFHNGCFMSDPRFFLEPNKTKKMVKKTVSFNDNANVQTYVLTKIEKDDKRTYSKKLRTIVKGRMTRFRKARTKEDIMKRAKRKLEMRAKIKLLRKQRKNNILSQ
jgi:hypothetical protein